MENNDLQRAYDLYSSLCSSDDLDIVAESYYGLARIDRLNNSPAGIVELIEKAANYGHAQAQYEYGLMLDEGSPTLKQDKGAAFIWFSAAANRGHILAAKAAGKCCIGISETSKAEDKKDAGKELAKNFFQKAVELFQNRLDNDEKVTPEEKAVVIESAYQAGKILCNGKGKNKEENESLLKTAKKLFRNAVEIFQSKLDNGEPVTSEEKATAGCRSVRAGKSAANIY